MSVGKRFIFVDVTVVKSLARVHDYKSQAVDSYCEYGINYSVLNMYYSVYSAVCKLPAHRFLYLFDTEQKWFVKGSYFVKLKSS